LVNPSGSTVVFTYIGFKDFEYKVTGNNSGLNVSLVGDAKVWTKLLLLVMVAKKKEVTGAVSTVDSKTLEILKPVKVEQALQGTVWC
jgi:hypothetical protein